MPEPTGRGSREFLPSANQALAALEQATGKPVMIVDAPELNVLATIRRAGPQDSSHMLRIKDGEKRAADYLIVFECQMALRDGSVPRAVLRDNPAVSINNPEQNHHLQRYRGGTNVTALQVVCILYVGVQLLLPGQDAGIDFAREYELAKGMAGADL